MVPWGAGVYIVRMRFPETLCALAPLVLASMAVAAGPPQEPDADTSALDLDRLVDELWEAGDPREVVSDDVPGAVLELSLEAARAICLTNDLALQGREQTVLAASHREVGSWGAFDWLFEASGGMSESATDASNIFDASTGTIDTSVQDLSLGFSRAFESGGHFSLSYGHNNTRTNSLFSLLETANQDVLSALYTRPLLRGSGSEFTTSLQVAADLRLRRERETYRLAKQQLMVRVEILYWELVLSEHQLDVAGSALDVALEQLDRDRRRRSAGVATVVEVIQDEATVARRIEGVLFAETALRSSMDQLRSTLFPGVESETWSVRLEPITPLPAISAAPAAQRWQAEIDAALEQRAEVRMVALDLELARLMHERTQSLKQPGLDLRVQLSSQGYDSKFSVAMEEALTYDFPSVSAGLAFQMPMGNVALEMEERAARAELRGAGLSLDAVRSSVAADLREALRQVRYQAEATKAAEKSREAAQRLMEAEQARHEQGLATNFQVLQFQQALVEAQYAEHATRAAYGKAAAILSGARGVIGEGQGARLP